MSSDSKRARLRNLFNSNPHCFWCGCEVILGTRNRNGNDHIACPPNMATLDHVISHINENWEKGAKNWIVLSCTECNQRRNKEETKTLSKKELWSRSGRYPVKHGKKLNAMK